MGTGDGSTDALSVNLARTAVEVAVPDEHAVLLEITAGRTGLQHATRELLREMHHRYVGWEQALADLHRQAAGDLHVYNRHERGPEGLAVFCDLYAKVVEEAGDPRVRDDAVRLWLGYLELIVTRSGPRLPRNLPVIEEALARLGAVLSASTELAATASSRLKRLVAALAAAPPEAQEALGRALALLAAALGAAYARWTVGEDPADWYRASPRAAQGGALPPPVERISHDHLRACGERIAAMARAPEGLRPHAAGLLGSPDDSEIRTAYVEAARVFTHDSDDAEDLLERIHWLLRVLARPQLDPVHETALRDVGRCCAQLLEQPRGRDALVREVFELLRSADLPRTRAFTDLVARIGCAAMASGDPHLAATLTDEMLGFEFAYPDFAGFTSEWEVRVNPAHLRYVRAYLAHHRGQPRPRRASGRIARGAPARRRRVRGRHRRLPAGRLGTPRVRGRAGVSRGQAAPAGLPGLLQGDRRRGPLRETSTRLDQIDQRRDPLCHFLRKQCHVECNPRLIAFAEGILRFWASGDADPLKAYVPGHELALLEEDGGRLEALHDDLAALTAGAGRGRGPAAPRSRGHRGPPRGPPAGRPARPGEDRPHLRGARGAAAQVRARPLGRDRPPARVPAGGRRAGAAISRPLSTGTTPAPRSSRRCAFSSELQAIVLQSRARRRPSRTST